MIDLSPSKSQIHFVLSFKDLIARPFSEEVNAMGWKRNLRGDFAEIVRKLESSDNIKTIEEEELLELDLSEQGELARALLLSDYRALEDHGASPVLNVIRSYERDEEPSFFPTDVYSFHVDRSPVPVDTFLCTYYGETSEIISNAQATKKVLIPEIREELLKLYGWGDDIGFETFLSENFYDLHYQPRAGSHPESLGLGHLYRLAIDYPGSQVLPCVHRAPKEKNGQSRLLLIC